MHSGTNILEQSVTGTILQSVLVFGLHSLLLIGQMVYCNIYRIFTTISPCQNSALIPDCGHADSPHHLEMILVINVLFIVHKVFYKIKKALILLKPEMLPRLRMVLRYSSGKI